MKNLNEGFDWFFWKVHGERPIVTEESLKQMKAELEQPIVTKEKTNVITEPVEILKTLILDKLNRMYHSVPCNVSVYKYTFKPYSLFYSNAMPKIAQDISMKYCINMEIFKDLLSGYLRNYLWNLAKYFCERLQDECDKQLQIARKNYGPLKTNVVFFSDQIFTMETQDWITFTVKLGFNFEPEMDENINLFGVGQQGMNTVVHSRN